MKKPFEVYVLALLMVVMGLMSIAGGGTFVIKPDGSLMKIPVSDLAHTPFTNFLIPGLILLIVLGILPLIITYAFFARPNSNFFGKLNVDHNMAWPWSWAIYYGFIVIMWIVIEIALIGYHSLMQTLVSILGVAILIVALLPRVRSYFRNYKL